MAFLYFFPAAIPYANTHQALYMYIKVEIRQQIVSIRCVNFAPWGWWANYSVYL